ncbi:MAG: hypothetical protein U0636_11980 [Phycisphaerales bacterium]
MDEPRTIVVKEIRIGEPAGSPEGGGASSPGWRIVQRLLGVLTAIVLLVLLIPVGLFAVGCGAVVLVGVMAWLMVRAMLAARRTAARQASAPQRENVRVREP